MHKYGTHTVRGRQPGNCHRMPIDRVDTTRPEQADQVQSLALRPLNRIDEHRVALKFTARNGSIDARQILQYRPAGAKVEMADLRVAHLALGQSHGFS